MENFYFVILLLLFVLVLGMCIPNLTERFSMTDYGEVDYYNWGLRPFNKKPHHKRGPRGPRGPPKIPSGDGEYKCYYTPSQTENNFCKKAMARCPLKIHPDLNNYIPKSMIPPQPNLNNYVLKSRIPPARCPDPQKCLPHPDMGTFKKYMKKMGKCPSCPNCPIFNGRRKGKGKSKALKKKTNQVRPSAGYVYV